MSNLNANVFFTTDYKRSVRASITLTGDKKIYIVIKNVAWREQLHILKSTNLEFLRFHECLIHRCVFSQ
jgi:hypothetical protein